MGTVIGPVLGAAVVFALQSLIQTLPFVAQGGRVSPGDISNIAYGLLIIAFLVTEPRGLAGLGSRLLALVRRHQGTIATEDHAVLTSSSNPLEEGNQ
jgi:ABC-type branched-subunit amino acid transport system permease subunit